MVIYPVDSAIQRLNNCDLALAYILSNGSIDHQGKLRAGVKEGNLVSLAAVFWMSRNAPLHCVTSKKLLRGRLRRSGLKREKGYKK